LICSKKWALNIKKGKLMDLKKGKCRKAKLKKTSVIALLCCINVICFCQEKSISEFNSALYPVKIDSLRNLFGHNKKIPTENELPILIALSYYPELEDTKIIFKNSKIKTTLNARPAILSLFTRNKRKYIVRINNKCSDSIVNLKKVSFEAKIGLFGHEFSHFIDYKKKNALQILGRLLSYTNLRGKERFEKEIDSMTISRGLGRQLYKWAFYVVNESNAKQKYKAFKKQIYLEPDEILGILNNKKSSDELLEPR